MAGNKKIEANSQEPKEPRKKRGKKATAEAPQPNGGADAEPAVDDTSDPFAVLETRAANTAETNEGETELNVEHLKDKIKANDFTSEGNDPPLLLEWAEKLKKQNLLIDDTKILEFIFYYQGIMDKTGDELAAAVKEIAVQQMGWKENPPAQAEPPAPAADTAAASAVSAPDASAGAPATTVAPGAVSSVRPAAATTSNAGATASVLGASASTGGATSGATVRQPGTTIQHSPEPARGTASAIEVSPAEPAPAPATTATAPAETGHAQTAQSATVYEPAGPETHQAQIDLAKRLHAEIQRQLARVTQGEIGTLKAAFNSATGVDWTPDFDIKKYVREEKLKLAERAILPENLKTFRDSGITEILERLKSLDWSSIPRDIHATGNTHLNILLASIRGVQNPAEVLNKVENFVREHAMQLTKGEGEGSALRSFYLTLAEIEDQAQTLISEAKNAEEKGKAKQALEDARKKLAEAEEKYRQAGGLLKGRLWGRDKKDAAETGLKSAREQYDAAVARVRATSVMDRLGEVNKLLDASIDQERVGWNLKETKFGQAAAWAGSKLYGLYKGLGGLNIIAVDDFLSRGSRGKVDFFYRKKVENVGEAETPPAQPATASTAQPGTTEARIPLTPAATGQRPAAETEIMSDELVKKRGLADRAVSWLGRSIGKALSVRTAIGIGLVGLTGGAAIGWWRGAMGVGGGVAMYEGLETSQENAAAKEAGELLKNFKENSENVNLAQLSDAMGHIQAMARYQGISPADEKFRLKNYYEALSKVLKLKWEEETAAIESANEAEAITRLARLNKFFNQADGQMAKTAEEQLKKMKNKKLRNIGIGVLTGGLVASGIFGKRGLDWLMDKFGYYDPTLYGPVVNWEDSPFAADNAEAAVREADLRVDHGVGAAAVAMAAAQEQASPEQVVIGPEMHEINDMNYTFGSTGTIEDGEGVLHAVNDIQRNIGDNNLVNRILSAHEDWQGRSPESVLRLWRVEQLERMGFVINRDGWGYPFTVHQGAQVEMYYDNNGYPQLFLIGEEGEDFTMHDNYDWHGHQAGRPTLGETPEIRPIEKMVAADQAEDWLKLSRLEMDGEEMANLLAELRGLSLEEYVNFANEVVRQAAEQGVTLPVEAAVPNMQVDAELVHSRILSDSPFSAAAHGGGGGSGEVVAARGGVDTTVAGGGGGTGQPAEAVSSRPSAPAVEARAVAPGGGTGVAAESSVVRPAVEQPAVAGQTTAVAAEQQTAAEASRPTEAAAEEHVAEQVPEERLQEVLARPGNEWLQSVRENVVAGDENTRLMLQSFKDFVDGYIVSSPDYVVTRNEILAAFQTVSSGQPVAEHLDEIELLFNSDSELPFVTNESHAVLLTNESGGRVFLYDDDHIFGKFVDTEGGDDQLIWWPDEEQGMAFAKYVEPEFRGDGSVIINEGEEVATGTSS
ncbi:MAG: hypothetical protein WC636_06660 [Candidatus Margulisiibacteriota bacterium]